MLFSRVPASLLLVVVVASVAMVAVRAVDGDDWRDEYTDVEPDLRASLPDRNDPTTRTLLGCSACRHSAVELAGALQDLKRHAVKRAGKGAPRGSPPSPAAQAAVPSQETLDDLFEEFCTKISEHYGLRIDDRQPRKVTPAFVQQGAPRLDGQWISIMFEEDCKVLLGSFKRSAGRRKWAYLSSLWDENQAITGAMLGRHCPVCGGDASGNAAHQPLPADKKARVVQDWDL